MRTPLTLLALGSLLAFAGARLALAEPPGGTYDLAISGDNSITVLEGDKVESDTGDGLSLTISSTVSTDERGRVTGTGSFDFTGSIEGSLPMTLTGQMRGVTKRPFAVLSISFSGDTVLTLDSGQMLAGTGSGIGKLVCRKPDLADPEMECGGRVRLCFEGMIGSKHLRVCRGGGGFTMHLPAPTDSWDLQLVLDPPDDRGKVTGTATATLDNNATQAFNVSGVYNSAKDVSVLKVTTVPKTRNFVVLVGLKTEGAAVTGGKAKFIMAGEVGLADLTPLP